MTRLLLLLTMLLACVGPAVAQEQEPARRRIEARVSALSGRSVYLDKGRDARIEPGDTVNVLPAGRPRVVAVVESVSRTGCRALLVEADGIAIGDRAEVLVPESRFADDVAEPPPEPAAVEQTPVRPERTPPEGARAEREVPDHPAWTHPPEEWNQDLPLLAPPEVSTPEDRAPTISGRLFLGLDHTWDDGQADREYALGRAGVDAWMENPFGLGGGAQVRAEAFHRSADVGGAGDEDETHLRVDRLSWYRGDTRERSERIEVGRFLQDAFPEFGVLDGVEFQQRTDGGSRWGASLGLAPIPNGELERGDDAQVAVFFRRDAPEDGALDWGIGAQKTWHDGAPDRDLVVADLNWRPSDRAWVYGSAWVDYYTSNDPVKSGVELTELRLGGNWRIGDDSGVHADVSRVRWPDIERYEFTPLPPNDLEDSQVTRVSVGGWHQASRTLRLNGRLNWWEDEDDDGAGAEVRAAWRDALWERGEVNLALFTNSGAFSAMTGARLGATRATRKGYVTATWEVANHEQDGFVGNQEELLQQVLRATWDTTLGRDWDLSLSADQRFGDEQDSLSLGFFLQRRF